MALIPNGYAEFHYAGPCDLERPLDRLPPRLKGRAADRRRDPTPNPMLSLATQARGLRVAAADRGVSERNEA